MTLANLEDNNGLLFGPVDTLDGHFEEKTIKYVNLYKTTKRNFKLVVYDCYHIYFWSPQSKGLS